MGKRILAIVLVIAMAALAGCAGARGTGAGDSWMPYPWNLYYEKLPYSVKWDPGTWSRQRTAMSRSDWRIAPHYVQEMYGEVSGDFRK